jgi:thiol-disulfide isomerase/thioredoxin
MKGIVAVLLLLFLLGAGAAAYYFFRIAPLIRAGKQQGLYAALPARTSAAGFGFETENGRRRTIADLKGNVVVIDVWATWCGTCLHTIPDIIALHNKYLDKPVVVLGLDVDDEGWTKVKPFLQKHPEINYTIAVPRPAPSFLLQSIVDLVPLGKVSALPTVFVVDREGKVAGKFIETGHDREIDDLVGRLLRE